MLLSFRKAVAENVADVRRIHQAAIREVCSQDYPAEVIAAWLTGNRDERYLRAIHAQSFWMVGLEKATIGFGGLDLERGKLESLFLDPQMRGRGIAGDFLAHLETVARDAGIRTLRLDSSLTAQAFYTRHGYRVCEGNGSILLEAGVLLKGIPMVKPLSA